MAAAARLKTSLPFDVPLVGLLVMRCPDVVGLVLVDIDADGASEERGLLRPAKAVEGRFLVMLAFSGGREVDAESLEGPLDGTRGFGALGWLVATL